MFYTMGAVPLLLVAAGALVLAILQPWASAKADRFLPFVMLLSVVALAIQINATFAQTYGPAAVRLRGLVALLVLGLGAWAMKRLIKRKLSWRRSLLLVAAYVTALTLVGAVAVQAAGRYNFLNWTQHAWAALGMVFLTLATLVTAATLAWLIIWAILRFVKKMVARAEERAKRRAEAKAKAAKAP